MSNIQLSVNCPKCGATNKFDQENIPTFCSFCGSSLPNMLPYVEDAVKVSIERQRHQMHMEAMDKEIQKEHVSQSGSKFGITAVIIVLILFVILQIIIYSRN